MNRIPGIRLPEAKIVKTSKNIRQIISSKRFALHQLKITRMRKGMTENTPRAPTFVRESSKCVQTFSNI